MRKSFWIVPLLLLSTAIGSTTARADTIDDYSISFSGADAPTVAAGTVLTYDVTTQQFTTPSFQVTFEGVVFTENLYSGFTPPETDTPPTSDVIGWRGEEVSPGTEELFINDATTVNTLYSSVPTSTVDAAHAVGMVSLTLVPEIDPQNATSALALLIGAILIIRGRRRKMTPSESGCEPA